IQDHLRASSGISLKEDLAFQKRFNGYYRVSRLPKKWYEAFYNIFDNSRNSIPAYSDLLTTLYAATNRCEASFASKLLATLDPTMPVIDSVVLGILNTKIPGPSTPNRLEKVALLHGEIGRCYKDFLKSKQGQSLISQFKATYPAESQLLTDIKMLDFILWQTREEKV
ncbi:MAG TPA: hypothetical protein VGB67_07750, partial [Fibrella sp.]